MGIAVPSRFKASCDYEVLFTPTYWWVLGNYISELSDHQSYELYKGKGPKILFFPFPVVALPAQAGLGAAGSRLQRSEDVSILSPARPCPMVPPHLPHKLPAMSWMLEIGFFFWVRSFDHGISCQ